MPRIITIAREYGSGGRLIAQKVAQKVGLVYYDNEDVYKRQGLLWVKINIQVQMQWQGRVNNYGVLEKRWLVKIFTT